MADEKAEKKKVQLSLNQIVGGALAATASAVAASFLGVYGTIVGAALMSVIYTAGSTLYEHTVDRSKNRLNDLRQNRGAAKTETPPAPAPGRWARIRAQLARVRAQLARPGWWKPVGAVSLLVFAVAIGAVTAIEAGVGKPMAAVVTGKHSSAGTSLRVATTGAEVKPAPSRPGHEGKPDGDEQNDPENDSGGQQNDNSPSTEQRPPGTTEPDQDTSRPTPGAGPDEQNPPAPTPTEAPKDNQQQRQAPSPQPMPTR